MGVRPFHEVLAAEGLDLGLEPDLLEFVKEQTRKGKTLDELCKSELISKAPLGPRHLLQIRLQAWRFLKLESAAKDLPDEFEIRNIMELQALRLAVRASRTHSVPVRDLFSTACAMAAAILKNGRIRMHLLNPQDPMSEEFSDLAEHTESLDGFPPHRWLKASRAVAEGLLWLDVMPPDTQSPGLAIGAIGPTLLEDLKHSTLKPVLDTMADMAQTKVITAAAEALLSMLSNPKISGPVAGLLMDGNFAYAAIVDDMNKSKRRRFDLGQMDRLVSWLDDEKTQNVTIARLKTKAPMRGIMGILQKRGISSEPASTAGVMKQARDLPGPIKEAAADVLACRHKDPVRGTQGLEPDELGLGEYLDRVDQDFLNFALKDAREAAVILTKQGTGIHGAKAAGNLNIMVHSIKDLRPGMEVGGVVLNITHFGAFVDLGLEQQGLIHISELSESRIDHPSQVVNVGQHVRVKVLQVDLARGRISLSMRSGHLADRGRKGRGRSESIKALDHLFNK